VRDSPEAGTSAASHGALHFGVGSRSAAVGASSTADASLPRPALQPMEEARLTCVSSGERMRLFLATAQWVKEMGVALMSALAIEPAAWVAVARAR
jgi:hypothetical protein